jgi:hypothetical protein
MNKKQNRTVVNETKLRVTRRRYLYPGPLVPGAAMSYPFTSRHASIFVQ